MAHSVGMFYFSGTGNTEIVAGLLQQAFRGGGAEAESTRIEDVLKGKVRLNVEDWDIIGIGHPIYGFDAPRIVYDFVDALPPVGSKRTFIFKTAGDFISVNNSASKTVIHRLRRKGYDVFYDRIFCMSPNWIVKYNDEFTKQLYNAAVVKAENMCAEVLSGKGRVLRIGAVSRLLARFVHFGEDLGARFFGKELYASRTCVQCDKCTRDCPTNNISRKNGKTRFGWDCIWCMRCIYECPQNAISPRFSRFCVVKGGYDVESVVHDGGIEGNYVTAETRGYYGHFIRYIRQADV